MNLKQLIYYSSQTLKQEAQMLSRYQLLKLKDRFVKYLHIWSINTLHLNLWIF